ncbi:MULTISPECIES: hypothetical protein [unclassified Nonomuraea]|uniref:hypothetical protein n=1 Tax=unclassified Nonomuraea TaxID=2593643 RepID=UPI0033C1AC12
MPFDLVRYAFLVAFIFLLAGGPAAGAITAAMLSASPSRHKFMGRGFVVGGLSVSLAGVLLLGLGAWLGREDSRYGIIEYLELLVIAFIGAGLLVTGLGPLPSWLLRLSGPYAERLPLPLRLAVRDLARRRVRVVLAITLAMVASAVGIVLTVIAVA